MLEQTLESVAGIHDELIVADGLIQNIWTELGHISDLDWLPSSETVHVQQGYWASQSAKRTFLLLKAKELECDWLLQIDADERLHNGELLREWLPSWAGDAFPLPFQVNADQLLGASWKCLRTAAWQRVTSGGAYLLHADGTEYCVVPPDGRGALVEYLRLAEVDAWRLPWLSHHPEERLGERKLIRLGDLEHDLEPVPDVPYYAPPGLRPRGLLDSAPMSSTPAEATHYCDQCGAKYSGPGLCEQGHPPNQVTPLAVADAAHEEALAAAEAEANRPAVTTADYSGPERRTATTDRRADVTSAENWTGDEKRVATEPRRAEDRPLEAAPAVDDPAAQAAPPAIDPVAQADAEAKGSPGGGSVAVAAGPVLARIRADLELLAGLVENV